MKKEWTSGRMLSDDDGNERTRRSRGCDVELRPIMAGAEHWQLQFTCANAIRSPPHSLRTQHQRSR